MSTYVRILKYVKPYWPHVIGSIVCILLFIVFSSVTLLTVQPFLTTIFHTTASVPESIETESGTTGNSIQNRFEGLVSRAYGAVMGPDWSSRPGECLHRWCLMLIVVYLAKICF